ncbi:MAG: endolytic transglycosylase MltG [Chitinophagaceae bacterium]
MKKAVLLIVMLAILAAAWFGWKFFGPATTFEGKNYYLLIKTGSTYQDVKTTLEQDHVISSPGVFEILAKRFDYPKKVKAGRYNIKKGMSLLNIVRMLKNGQQEPVNLVITKLRTKEDLASLVGRKFECDSAAFMAYITNADSLKQFNLDSNTVMTSVFPNTYTYFWNTTPSKIFAKLSAFHESFWTAARTEQAREHGLNPQTAYTLASIVEEETLKKEDKGKIASVYLNRIAKGMRLAADPTVKYALRQFGLKRVYEKHLAVESPYNTYKVMGLPPGPICTPSANTIDAVLTSPKTNYVFFVAKASLDGYSNFAETYAEHQKYAKEYRDALDKIMQAKQPATNNLAQ